MQGTLDAPSTTRLVTIPAAARQGPRPLGQKPDGSVSLPPAADPSQPWTAALIACHLLWRELSQVSAASPLRIDPVFLEQGLHNEPVNLQKKLQAAIDAVDGRCDVILLGYGLCSNGLTGLTSRQTPLVIPRGHDCLTLILGSKEQFADFFATHRGTYWYSAGWIETGTLPDARYLERLSQAYLQRYEDPDIVDFLLGEERRWMHEYQTACFISQPELGLPAGQAAAFRQYAQASAAACGWQYAEQTGSLDLLQSLVSGPWDEARFLVTQPGQQVQPSFAADIVRAVPAAGIVDEAQPALLL